MGRIKTEPLDTFTDLDIAALSVAGRKRAKESNQDSLRVLPADPRRGLPVLLILADGMGGYAGGAVASQLLVETVELHYKEAEIPLDLPALLNDCLQAALQAMKQHSEDHPEHASMGSTVVIAAVENEKVTLVNVGDSRAYHLHGSEMDLVSYDHSVVADMVRSKEITPLQARSHPKRNRLTQSISPKRKTFTPYVTQFHFSEDDILVLCTDGLWGVVPEALLQAISQELSPGEAVKKLISFANQNGGPDNISVIIARRKGITMEKPYNEDETNPGV